MPTAEIKRFDRSVNPWRLLINGKEVAVPEIFDHSTLGPTTISRSISGATRRECEQKALALLAMFVAAEIS